MRRTHTSHDAMALAPWLDWEHCCVVAAIKHDDANGKPIMTDLAALSKEQLIALLTASQQPKALTMKVSEKGALSIYGLGRFPVTLYRGQWERLLGAQATISAFIETNAALLSVKA